MDLKLYVFPGGDGISSVSPPCVRVQLALSRSGAAYDLVYVKSSSEAAKHSATGRLPAVAIDGQRFSDSTEILDQLERRLPDFSLSPADPVAKMRDRLWEHYVNDHLYWMGYYMRWVDPKTNQLFLDAMLERAPFLMKMMAPRVLRRFAKNRSQYVGIRGKTVEEVLRAFDRALDNFVLGLAGGPFFEGRDTPGRGDLAAASMVCQAGFRGTMPDVEERVRKRPEVLDHCRGVFAACKTDLPRWLE